MDSTRATQESRLVKKQLRPDYLANRRFLKAYNQMYIAYKSMVFYPDKNLIMNMRTSFSDFNRFISTFLTTTIWMILITEGFQ